VATKIAAFIITFLLNAGASVVILFAMLIAMNGYSENDAMWGLGVYVLLALVVAVLSSLGSVLLVQLLLKKQYSASISTLIAIPVFTIAGVGLEVVCSLIGIGVAEIVRVKF
jgi:hypothetical protein